MRTLLGAFDAPLAVRSPIYVALVAVWLLGIALVVRRHRREGTPLFNRETPALARGS